MVEGLRIPGDVKARPGVPIQTNIYEPKQAAPVPKVVDTIPTSAFLAQQTDLVAAAGCAG